MKNLYASLAKNGIKKNREVYVPYGIAIIFLVAVFSIMESIIYNEALDSEYGMNHVKTILGLGLIIMAIFSVIFLIYGNRFIMKKRAREFGLYNILGLDKRQISKIVVIEALFVGVTSIILGLAFSALFYRLFEGLFFKMMDYKTDISNMADIRGLIKTALVYLGILIFIIIARLREIKKSNPIELFKKEKVGDKNKISTKITAVLGVALLAIGYYMALTSDSIVDSLQIFLLATIFVICGTFLGFNAITTVVLNGLSKNEKFYYKTNNFVSISGLRHRIRQNAAGLASICIMSCATLVLIGSSFALYFSAHQTIDEIFPREINFVVYKNEVAEEDLKNLENEREKLIESYDIKEDQLDIRYSILFGEETEDSLISLSTDGLNNKRYKMIYLVDKNSVDDYRNLELDNNKGLLLGSNQGIKTFELPGGDLEIESIKDDFDYTMTIHRLSIFEPEIILVNNLDKISAENRDKIDSYTEMEYFGIDSDKNSDEIYSEVKDFNNSQGIEVSQKKIEMREFMIIMGGIIFVGAFLGIVFVLGTGLVIYYKQLSEGYEDIKRFKIYRNVGMTEKEVKASIKTQLKLFFLLPPVMAGIHLMVAFKPISDILKIIGLMNLHSKMMAFVIVYSVYIVFYFIIYRLTSKSYYKIVSNNKRP